MTETVVAVFLLFWLGCFFSVSLHNIVKRQKLRSGEKVCAEIERPLGSTIGLAAVGTLIYFLEVFSYLFLVFTGLIFGLRDFPLFFRFPFTFSIQILGSVLTSVGYFIFIWSVIVRGKYAVSWAMPKNQRLVTWGPYRYVRHPSYLGYFFMFFGFFFLWPNLFTLFPLVAIPGYFRVTFEEERLLVRQSTGNIRQRTRRYMKAYEGWIAPDMKKLVCDQCSLSISVLCYRTTFTGNIMKCDVVTRKKLKNAWKTLYSLFNVSLIRRKLKTWLKRNEMNSQNSQNRVSEKLFNYFPSYK